jgi:hypothetical protein
MSRLLCVSVSGAPARGQYCAHLTRLPVSVRKKLVFRKEREEREQGVSDRKKTTAPSLAFVEFGGHNDEARAELQAMVSFIEGH